MSCTVLIHLLDVPFAVLWDCNESCSPLGMITFEKFGQTVSITNRDWDQLKKRLDIKNFKKTEYGLENYRKCSFCSKYSSDNTCAKCPFSVFGLKDKGLNCLVFIGKYFKEGCVIDFGTRELFISKRHIKEGKRQLKRLYNEMLRIEAKQVGK